MGYGLSRSVHHNTKVAQPFHWVNKYMLFVTQTWFLTSHLARENIFSFNKISKNFANKLDLPLVNKISTENFASNDSSLCGCRSCLDAPSLLLVQLYVCGVSL